MNRTLVAVLGLSILMLLQPRLATAHEVRPAYLEITEHPRQRISVLWKQPIQGSLAVRLSPTLSIGILGTPPSEQQITTAYLVRRWNDRSLARENLDGATVRIEGLENTITDAFVNVNLSNGQQIQTVLKPSEPQFTIHVPRAEHSSVAAYFTLGVQHIFTGFDHLSLLAGLIFLIQRRWKLLQAITAFTLAHSITLGATVLGYVQANSAIIEPLVALSIVLVAAELPRSPQFQNSLTVRCPWIVALAFGLLHGFAFASFLLQAGLPKETVAGALILFNLGVETGQLLFVGSMLAVMTFIRKANPPWTRIHEGHLLAYGIGIPACYWLFQRMDLLVS